MECAPRQANRRRSVVVGLSAKTNRFFMMAGRQGMRVVAAGNEGAAGESSPDFPCRTALY